MKLYYTKREKSVDPTAYYYLCESDEEYAKINECERSYGCYAYWDYDCWVGREFEFVGKRKRKIDDRFVHPITIEYYYIKPGTITGEKDGSNFDMRFCET